jgi:penicillin amidase
VRKWLLSVALAVFVVLSTAAGYVFLALRASLPPLDGDVTVAGLGAPVSVTFDRLGIPAITAGSRLDALRALGYVTARDRLFQMDMLRRRSAGRLAEVMGPSLLGRDLDQRIIGFRRVAPAVVDQLPHDQQEALKAYVEGVNQFIAHLRSPPVEFRLLGYRPGPWRVEDSVLVAPGDVPGPEPS